MFTPADVAALKPGLVVRTPDAYRRHTLIAAGIFFLAFWLLHSVRRIGAVTGDPLLLPAAHLLVGLSFMAMMVLRDPLRDTDAATGLVYGAALGCGLFAVLSFVDFENPRYRRSTLLPLGAAVACSAALVIFGTGPGESGVKVNLLGVQPIEAIRVLAILALASYFSRRWELLREISEPVGPSAVVRRHVRLPRARDFKPLALIVGTLLVFCFLQRDLGPALVLGCISMVMYGVARGRVPLVAAGLLALVAGFAVGYWLGVPATLARRVDIWLDPWNNGRTGGDQIAHALWALASGGALGAGTGVGDGYLIPHGQTDLIVAVIGEELGFTGVLVIALLYSFLVWRVLRISARAPGDYTAFLALGCALSLAVPALIIVAGELSVIPLAGVATPFLSFGKSSMVASFTALAIASGIATQAGAVRPAFARQLQIVGWILAALAAVIVGRAAWIQLPYADDVALRPALVRQADGDVRYRYNPRLLLAARVLPRGAVLDRNGYALATNDPGRTEALKGRLYSLRVGITSDCPPAPARCYPLGSFAFHALGEPARQTNWAARNASYVERDSNSVLQGFDDRARPVEVRRADGRTSTVIERDYRELLPLLRHKRDPNHPDVQQLLQRQRDVQVTIDGPFQALVA
ncbi:MAG: FtsW/RodA/SpoVE family cell cycle protein, partial [Planctomycetota bacterium]|nr:FtsW/RodA/SpoVE family cell cycle protein [Planctomycetota bacterium]